MARCTGTAGRTRQTSRARIPLVSITQHSTSNAYFRHGSGMTYKNKEREQYMVPVEENSSVHHAKLHAFRRGGPQVRQNSTAGQLGMTQTGKTEPDYIQSRIFGTVLIFFEQQARSVNANAVAPMSSPDVQVPKPLPHARCVLQRQYHAKHQKS